ncbi:putative baseplate assembly protein [Dyella sp. M7H15-1]|uniref:baseplate J/gp47 family protein n=1 Tax=Dyella sp. M7H15-1 TaxID=2501295 RepID=UPI001004D99C|nr:baseplate J/gp47 family protein [Dyella sp. M7H15-1]QAU23610.1 putative baseplate assembly protein [Dyella sp. M7H15-1]
MIYFCAQKNRRDLVLASNSLNGIDYLEVPGMCGCGTQLAVTFLKDARALALAPANIVITGDTPLQVTAITPASDEDPRVITVQLNETGDFSRYTFSLVAAPDVVDPPEGLDPQLSTLSFSFKAGCPTPVDCLPAESCPPPAQTPPDINYLAKDYGGFLQVMQDRMSVLVPGWTETHAADMGVAMMEALAYAADHLSYQQDAVSTEAYLNTARSRISLRRHARLVDDMIGEGCNARVWMYLETLADGVVIPQGTEFYVRTPGLPAVIDPSNLQQVQLLQGSTQPIFASLQATQLFLEQNQIDFYTWGDADCCLPAGATQATLVGHLNSLAPDSMLIFQEALGPLTGSPDDADPTHRWAVRLTSVTTTNYQGLPLCDPLNGQPITRIAWSSDDALPFPLCLSSTTSATAGGQPLYNASVALGNIVPADHGIWIENESLGNVPAAPPAPDADTRCPCGATSSSTPAPIAPLPRFYPELSQAPLTFTIAYDATAPATAFPIGEASGALAQIHLLSDDGQSWQPVEDLLASGPEDALFIPEIEYTGAVFLRFGDDQYGQAPASGLSFTAHYRIGNGSVGNVGHDAIAHVIFAPHTLRSVRNPLAAAGGTDAESMEHICQYAPYAFQTQERCVTEADYGSMAAQISGVEQARGTLRWTGSWYTAFVSVEPVTRLTTPLIRGTTQRLNLLRMMGTDLAVEGAVMVGLQITLQICVDPAYFQGDVYAALMRVFITGNQCNGQTGLLNASQFTFGEMVYASPLIAAAQAVDGVLSASLTTFTRMDNPWVNGVAQGYLGLGPLEIACCDNDPDHLDHGLFTLQMDGGK